MKKSIYILAPVSIIVAVTAVIVIIHLQQTSAQNIPIGSYIKQARKLSIGTKPTCLTDNKQATAAVNSDDTFINNDPDASKFELAAAEGIIDVPAGTMFDTTVNSYNNTVAKGTIIYQKGYGTYNYTIQKGVHKGDWTLQSLIACTK